MKTLKVVLSAIVLLYFVENAKCAVLKSELSKIELEEEAILGLLDKWEAILLSGYDAEIEIIDEMIKRNDDFGLLDFLFEILDDELTKQEEKQEKELKKLDGKEESILIDKDALAKAVEEARQSINNLIDDYKRLHTTSLILDSAVESAKNAKLAQKIVNEGPDVVRNRLYDIDRDLKDYGLEQAKKLINKEEPEETILKTN